MSGNSRARIATWIGSTATLVVLLFGYHTSTAGAPGAGSSTAIHASATPSTSSTSSTPGTSGSSTATYTGDTAMTRYGPMRVQVSVSGGQITDVSVPQYPDGDGQSLQINHYALPILAGDTVDQQSAQVHMVSGATFTSMGYQQSLQSALDQAGL